MGKVRRYHETRAVLHAQFPAAFPACEQPVPLKIGIRRDLWTTGIELPGWAIRKFLDTWTARPEYLAAVAAGGPRYDLHGEPCGEVSEDAARFAAETLAKRQERVPA